MEGAETEMNEVNQMDEMNRQTSIKIEERANPMLGDHPSYEPEEDMPAPATAQPRPLHKQASDRLQRELQKSCTARFREKTVRIAGPKIVGDNANLMPENCVCILVMIVNLIGFAFFAYLTYDTYQTEVQRPYLSAVKATDGSAKCETIKNMIDETYRLDDDGYWSTNGKFSFRKSLIQAQFRAYERTNSVYKDNMKSLYKEIKQVNYELESTPMDRAIVTLATMRRDVGGDKSLLLLPDVAPPRIMDTPVKEIKLFKGDDDTDSPTKEPTASGTSSPTVAPIPTSSPTSAPTGECGEVGIYGNLCDLTFDIVETERYVWLQAKLAHLQCCYPNFKTSATVDTGDGDMVTLKINRYSLFVAAAVNMGVLNTTSLTSTNYDYEDDDYEGVYDDDEGSNDDDDNGDNGGTDNGGTDDGGTDDGGTDDGGADDGGTDDGDEGDDRRRRTTDGDDIWDDNFYDDKYDDGYYNYTDWSQVDNFVSRKFIEEMDPIQCSRTSGVTDRCWLQTNANEDNTEGLVLFPVIQAQDYRCRECSDESCTDSFELNYVLLFDGNEPETAVNVDYDAGKDYACHFDYCNTSWADDDAYYDDGADELGVDSAIIFKHTGNIDFLNDHFYNKPKADDDSGAITDEEAFHCNGQGFFDIIPTSSTSSSACTNSKASKIKYCKKPPEDLEESYYTCTLKPIGALTKAVSSAYGVLASIMAVVSPTLLVVMGKLYAQRIMEQKVANEVNDAKRMSELIEARAWEKKGQ